MYYYHKSTGFLHPSVHDNIPSDAVEIPDIYHHYLMEKQKENDVIIGHDEEGFPIPIDDSVKEEEQIDLVRLHRNKILNSTDWTQLPDVPKTLKEKYKTYRQALRDIPEQEGFPFDVTWPEKPE